MHDSDRNLVDAHLQGEDGAFETLIRRYGPYVLGYLTKMTNHRDHAEDLFQETFVRVHERAGQFRGENLKGWLFTIATRLAAGHFRRARRTAAVSLNQPAEVCADGVHCATLEGIIPDGGLGPEDQAELEEKRRRVREALGRLPEKQRTAVVLSYYQHMTYAQIAETMGCSLGAVKTHMFRAMKRLSTLLDEQTGGIG